MAQNNTPLETEVTKQVANYLRYKQIPFIHIPNEAKRSMATAMLLKAMGMSAGFPDMFIFTPKGKFHGMALELKREKGGVVSKQQAEWLHTLKEQGYFTAVGKGYNDAKSLIDWYLDQED